MIFRTRFAPSPTGPLHLGHAYSALVAHDLAQENGGDFLLRIEDIDQSRAKSEWEQQIYDDLNWLGLRWETPVLRQSEHLASYGAALKDLWDRGLLYPCFCNRRDILAAAAAPQEGAPLLGPDGIIYPGTCRHLPRDPEAPIPENTALRLDLQAASQVITGPLVFQETGGVSRADAMSPLDVSDLKETVGDVVVSRRDMGTSYHLSVVLDDARQRISHVVRGQDLFEAMPIHVLLQKLLNLPTPCYHHHRLIRDAAGKRLAKRDDARALSKYRAEGASPDDIRRMAGLLPS
ncbi:MAG: tRNA glutamyl-Q(34) synthetase GluQRS [Pseudomonadota bacterium]